MYLCIYAGVELVESREWPYVVKVCYTSVMQGINNGPWKLVMLFLLYKDKALYIIKHFKVWLIILIAFLSLFL